MATITKNFCDRCGGEIKDATFLGCHIRSKGYTVSLETHVRDYSYEKEFDLCDECKTELEQWIKGGNK